MLKKLSSILLIILLLLQSAFANEIVLDNMEEVPSLNQQEIFLTGGVNIQADKITTPLETDEYLPIFYSTASFSEILPMYIEAHIEEYDALPTIIAGIESFGITLENLEKNYYDAAMRNPYLLLKTGCGYYDTNNDGVIEAIVPRFLVADTDELKEAQAAIDDGMQEYIDLANKHEGPLEKLLAIHDRMVENCIYDERVMNSDPAIVAQAPDSVYHAIGVFRDKFAVCQGYSMALYMLGKELGIEIDLCVSNDVNHMWNYVKMDGKWYHMDMTNEDPKDAEGRASHRFFLISDNSTYEDAHGTSWRVYGTDSGYDCSDTTYESNHYFNTGFLFKGIKNSDGCYHTSVGFKNTSAGINTTVTIKSPSLYTGPIIVAPFIAEGKYTTTENGSTVTKTGTNLYMIERSVGTSSPAFPLIQYKNRFVRLSDKAAATKGVTALRIVAPDAEEMNLTDFTSFMLGVENLTPYSTKYNWR